MADKKPKRPRDLNQLAKLMVDIATGEVKEPKRPAKKVRQESAESKPS